MTVDTLSTIRNYLCSTSAVTTLVPITDIRVGYQTELVNFPSLAIYQIGGTDVGYMGYNRSTSGNRLRLETSNINVDIISRTSMYHTYQIADAIVPVMISGGCRKMQDVDLYDTEMEVYRKVLTFRNQRHQTD